MNRLLTIEVSRETDTDWTWDVHFIWIDSESGESTIKNYPIRSDNGENIGEHIAKVLDAQ